MCSTLVLCVRFHATFPPAELGPSSPHTRFRPVPAHHPPKPPHTLAQHQPFPTSSTVCRPPQPGFTRSRHRPGRSPPPKTLLRFFFFFFSVPDFSRFGNKAEGDVLCGPRPNRAAIPYANPDSGVSASPAQPSPAPSTGTPSSCPRCTTSQRVRSSRPPISSSFSIQFSSERGTLQPPSKDGR